MTDKPTYEELELKVQSIEKEVSKRKQAEEALRLEESRLEALLELNQMTGAPLQEITDFAMEEAVRLTESKIGYLAFMNQDETVLTMHSWSKNAMKQCVIADKPKVYPVFTTGLWGEAVRQRKPVITNDYAAPNPLKHGYPEGHVHVIRHLNIPVFDGDRIIAVAGVGNKEDEYDESDVRQLQLLMQGMWRLILRKWTEWELRESEAKFRQLVETVGGAIFIYQGTKIRFANQASEIIFGYTREELLSKNFWEVIHPDYQKMVKKRGFARQRGEKVPSRYEAKVLRKNGEEGWCDFTLSLIEFEGKTAVLGIALDITERKRTEKALEESEDKLRQLSTYLLTAQEGERKRISFELHDEMGQSLTALKLKISSIERKLEGNQEKLSAACVHVLDNIDQIIENIRRLTRDLSPSILEDLGLTGALRWMVDDFGKLNKKKISFAIEDINNLFSQESQIIIYRIFQEALTNVGKHSQAKHVSVFSNNLKDSVCFVVEDDGKGFDMNQLLLENPNKKSLGLAAMHERARMLGASFNILSQIGRGTQIKLTVPVNAL
jgi:PAS domain S-box-containing protein